MSRCKGFRLASMDSIFMKKAIVPIMAKLPADITWGQVSGVGRSSTLDDVLGSAAA